MTASTKFTIPVVDKSPISSGFFSATFSHLIHSSLLSTCPRLNWGPRFPVNHWWFTKAMRASQLSDPVGILLQFLLIRQCSKTSTSCQRVAVVLHYPPRICTSSTVKHSWKSVQVRLNPANELRIHRKFWQLDWNARDWQKTQQWPTENNQKQCKLSDSHAY